MGTQKPRDLAEKGSADAAASHPSSRDRLLQEFRFTRALTLELADPLSTEDMVVQTMPDVSPTKWHMAHTTWFFDTFLLKPNVKPYQPFHEAFEYLFNSYYNAVGEQFPRPERGLLSRPTVSEVVDYRTHVDDGMESLIAECATDTWNEIAPLIELGIHHEQQHQELMVTDIKHVLSWNPLKPAAYGVKPKVLRKAASLSFIDFEGGIFEFGHQSPAFAFDCEGPRHEELVRPFQMANRPVTNGEFLEFIEDGGYRTPHLWLSDGWADLQEGNWQCPLYWSQEDGVWTEFTLHGPQKLNPVLPLTHVNYYEAAAFAAWKGARLPYETELELAADTQDVCGNFLTTEHMHPSPVESLESGKLLQIYGDVWEWTQSAYSPYPGFSPAAGAVGEYNGKFMSGQLVLKGGSCATPPGHMRPTYRNFFPPAARWQFSGIRLAKDI